jgi:hypothetical protein
VDIVAPKETIWSISPGQTTGILFFGILPLEEVVFFFITNILLIFGVTLLLANVSQERFTEIKDQIRAWTSCISNPVLCHTPSRYPSGEPTESFEKGSFSLRAYAVCGEWTCARGLMEKESKRQSAGALTRS